MDAVLEMAELVVTLADNRYLFGRRISEWIIKAPALEQGVACAALAGEEMGFARVLYGILDQLPVAGTPAPLTTGAERKELFCLSFLERPLPSWAFVVAALNLVDPALNLLTEVLARSGYGPLAQRCRRILGEERFHDKYALGRLHDAARFPAVVARLQEALRELWPETLMWFGRDASTRWPVLTEAGLLSIEADLMAECEGRVLGRLRQAGFDFLLPSAADLALPWELWDSRRRRMTAQATLRIDDPAGPCRILEGRR